MATPNHYAPDLSQLPKAPAVPSADAEGVEFKTLTPVSSSETLDEEKTLTTISLKTVPVDVTEPAADIAEPPVAAPASVNAAEKGASALELKWERADEAIRTACGSSSEQSRSKIEYVQWLSANVPLLQMVLKETREGLPEALKLPKVQGRDSGVVPRAYLLGQDFLRTEKYKFSQDALVAFLKQAQEVQPLRMAELWGLKALMELVVLERIAEIARGRESSAQSETSKTVIPISTADATLPTLVPCLQRIVELDWDAIFEEVSATELILRQDPLGAYQRMDAESRDIYRKTVVQLAARSKQTEEDVARKAVELARALHPASSRRATERMSHVGYYLLGEGRFALKQAIGYDVPLKERVHEAILRSPTAFYFSGIALLTLAVMLLFAAIPGVRALRWYEITLFFLPAVECAVATLNLLTTMVVPPHKLPRFDLSEGVPAENTTMVVIPMLLGSEEQVKHAVRDLEIRYLANRQANLYFGLLTDPPDAMVAFDDKDKLAGVCSQMIEKLNAKYASDGHGSFFLFHRDRSYNAFDKVWMGWERKRGKLLDLNNLLLGRSDNFSVKTGDLSVLPAVRYIITLDQDTQLPKDSALKLVGALVHPLNRAVIDPTTNTVVEGYGILQPRVGISVKSKNRSRLAALFSGEVGLDIYTRAISDVYQDLFGEGIFTGKGIYEVDVFQQVLDHRFPCNAVLSHDLLEGVYTRAGLLSDVEVIDDYPSHVSAYSRRKHRWVRGDWQIIRWLLPQVPDNSGKTVHNPLTPISRWKIIDNLRRSLTEFAFFVLLLCGWFVLPGKALYWTLATVLAMSLPIYVQFFRSIIGALRSRSLTTDFKNIVSDFWKAQAGFVFRLALLFHQSLVTLDAVVRTLIRMTVTRKSLLQWETAAEAESLVSKKNPVEMYLDLAPWLCFGIDLLVVTLRPYSILIALPFLTLWGCSKAICEWLNMPYWTSTNKLSDKDRSMLRGAALRTWRFFRQYSNAGENWLIPDITHEELDLVAHRLSPTNLGFLLNSRLAAFDLGWTSLTEFIGDMEKTFDTMARMPKRDGQYFNWYDTRTLEAVSPRFISTVDNGNLVCCLWTVQQACLEAPAKRLFRHALLQGISDHLETISELLAENGRNSMLVHAVEHLKLQVKASSSAVVPWPETLQILAPEILAFEKKISAANVREDVRWWMRELSARMKNLQEMVYDFAPWLLPVFAPYRALLGIQNKAKIEALSLESLAVLQSSLDKKVREIIADKQTDGATRSAMELLLSSLSRSIGTTQTATSRLLDLANAAEASAKEIDFAFLYNSEKKQLSIGYDVERDCLHEAHYDLLASEARAAVFAAIAKGNIPQAAWFRLGRPRKTYQQAGVLVSWTGTMFEYLLPMLWMRTYPNTLLEESAKTAVKAQQDYAAAKSVPWGISESSCSDRNPDYHYRYHAFGLPSLALNHGEGDDLVISPYSSFLALLVDPQAAMKNLHEMKARGWIGTQGFYDACDFTPSRMNGKKPEPVTCFMAHHQGMILVTAASVLNDLSMQRRFHAEPMVAATERLLQEKLPRTGALELELAEKPCEAPATTAKPAREALLPAD
jgi:cyclic beta-1,2-glucan synthetase